MKFIGDENNKALWTKHYIAVKCKIKQPEKNGKVSVKTKRGGDYSYSYATLANIDSVIVEACKQVTDKDGNPVFSYMADATVDQEGVSAKTILIDASGYIVESSPVWFKNFNSGDAQKTASLITYAKRYSLSAAFGIASDDDDDARSLGHPEPQQIKRLNSTELNSYEVDFNGAPTKLVEVWNLATDDDIEAQNWIKGRHDAQTASAIQQLARQQKLEERIAEAKKRKAEKAQKQASKPGENNEAQDTTKEVQEVNSQENSTNNSNQQFTAESLF